MQVDRCASKDGGVKGAVVGEERIGMEAAKKFVERRMELGRKEETLGAAEGRPENGRISSGDAEG